jgi:hypothetical protein
VTVDESHKERMLYILCTFTVRGRFVLVEVGTK